MPNLSYGTYDEETAEQEKEELSAQGAEFMKLKVGRNIVRVLPPPKGEKSPFRVVFQHFIEMPGGSKSVICARLEAKKPCTVCEHVNRLRKSTIKADQDAANDLFARRRVFCNVIDRSDEASGPKLLAFGKTVHEQLTTLRTDPAAGGNYIDPFEGSDVIITRTGTGKNDTKYQVALARKTTTLEKHGNEKIMQDWIDNQADLNKFAKLPSTAEVRALLAGEEPPGDAEDEDEDEDIAPSPKKVAPKSGAVERARAAQSSAKAARSATPMRSPKKRSIDADAVDEDLEDEDDLDEDD